MREERVTTKRVSGKENKDEKYPKIPKKTREKQKRTKPTRKATCSVLLSLRLIQIALPNRHPYLPGCLFFSRLTLLGVADAVRCMDLEKV
jgi:hypothetical protein